MYKIYLQVINIIVEYYKLYYVYINFFNKTTLICLLLFLISFFKFFSSVFINFDQYLSHRYFSIYPDIFLKSNN